MSTIDGTFGSESTGASANTSQLSVNRTESKAEKKPGIVGQIAHNALSKENFVGMGAGFVAREVLKQVVGGPVIAPVIGTVSAVASGIAREVHRAHQIGNFSDYLRYQRGEISYEKLTKEQKARIKEQEERLKIMRATPLPKRLFGAVASGIASVGHRVEDVTGVGRKIKEASKQVKAQIIQTSGYTNISDRFVKAGQTVTQGVSRVIQSKEGQAVIRVARRADTKVKDIATGQSQRLKRLDRITGTENGQPNI